jgi:integrase
LKEVLVSRIAKVKTGRIFEYDEVKNMGKAFSSYLEVINLAGKGYNLRTFRKDFISRYQELGISIATTALLVGHSNIKTTMTYYTKLFSAY